MPVAAGQAVQPVPQGPRIVLVAGIGALVDIQPRHLVEADDAVGRTPRQILVHPCGEFPVAPMIVQPFDRHAIHLAAGRNDSLPLQGIDADGMSTGLTDPRDAQTVALQSAVREVFEKSERQLRRGIRSVRSGASARLRQGARRKASPQPLGIWRKTADIEIRLEKP